MGKYEYLLDSVFTIENGEASCVDGKADTNLMVALLTQTYKNDFPKAVVVIKINQIYLEYIDITKLSSSDDGREMLETFYMVNQLWGRENTQIRILVDREWQRLCVLNTARRLLLTDDFNFPQIRAKDLNSGDLHFIRKCLISQNENSPNLMTSSFSQPHQELPDSDESDNLLEDDYDDLKKKDAHEKDYYFKATFRQQEGIQCYDIEE